MDKPKFEDFEKSDLGVSSINMLIMKAMGWTMNAGLWKDALGRAVSPIDPYNSLDDCHEAEDWLSYEETFLYAGYIRGMVSKWFKEGTPYAEIEWAITHLEAHHRCHAYLAIKGLVE